MRRQYLLSGFLAGLILGAGLVAAWVGARAAAEGKHADAERARAEYANERAREQWRATLPAMATNYFWSERRVPIPRTLDFSTNAWRQMNYWRSFALAYVSISTNPPLGPRRYTAGRIYSFNLVGAPMRDWMEGPDGVAAADAAHDALLQVQAGMQYDDLVQWVSTHCGPSSDYPQWFTNHYPWAISGVTIPQATAAAEAGRGHIGADGK
jgi:hypothetical protein